LGKSEDACGQTGFPNYCETNPQFLNAARLKKPTYMNGEVLFPFGEALEHFTFNGTVVDRSSSIENEAPQPLDGNRE
jgi:hypothetical protein